MKRVTLWVDATQGSLTKKLIPLFGEIDVDALYKAHKGAGLEMRSKRKMGVSVVKLYDSMGKVIVEAPTARVERPKLVIGAESKTAWLILHAEIGANKAACAALDDSFKCDVTVSVANSQLDLEDEAKAKVEEQKKKNADRKAKVKWTKRKPKT